MRDGRAMAWTHQGTQAGDPDAVAGTKGAPLTPHRGRTTAGGEGWLWSISTTFPVEK